MTLATAGVFDRQRTKLSLNDSRCRTRSVLLIVQRIKFLLKRSACSTHSAAHGADLNKSIDNARTQPRYLCRSNLERTFTQLGSCTHARTLSRASRRLRGNFQRCAAHTACNASCRTVKRACDLKPETAFPLALPGNGRLLHCPRFSTDLLVAEMRISPPSLLNDHLLRYPSWRFAEDTLSDQTRPLGDRNALVESHLDIAYRNVSISGHACERMRTLSISSEMIAETLNAPDRVRHLPLSNVLSYFCEFNGRTLRVMATLDDRIITVSWTTNQPTDNE